MLSGDGGLGKSLFGLQLGVAVATATDWIGSLTEPGPVILLSAEDGEDDEIYRQLPDVVVSRALDLADLADFPIRVPGWPRRYPVLTPKAVPARWRGHSCSRRQRPRSQRSGRGRRGP